MTIPRRDNGDTPNGDYIRNRPELNSRLGYDLEDIDHIHTRLYYWHQWLRGELMIIEEKQYNRDITDAQKDTFGIIHQALRRAFSDPEFRVKRRFPGRTNKYTYFGYHLIQFEKTSPLDGGIRVNYQSVTEQEYLRFLQFDRCFIEERLRFNPLTISINDLLQSSKRRLHNGRHPNIPNLFDLTPIQQQDLWEVAR